MLYEQNNLVDVRIDKVNAAARVRWVAAVAVCQVGFK
jgi:hypothetical protein